MPLNSRKEELDLPLVSLIIPTHNRKEKLFRLLNSILNGGYPKERTEIVIVDDASSDGTFEAVKAGFPMDSIRIIRNEKNLLVANARNLGIINSKGEYIYFIDDDVVIDKDTVYSLVKFMQHGNSDNIVGPVIYQFQACNQIWSAGVRLNFWTAYGTFLAQGEIGVGQLKRPVECDALASTFMVHKHTLDKVGFFNSDFFPTAFEELDFCIRSRLLGSRVLVLPQAKAWHEHKSAEFLAKPRDLYYGTRNRLIAHKLWSKNGFQNVISRACAILFTFGILLLKSTLYPKNYIQCAKAIFKGLLDGLKISSRKESYATSLKRGGSIKYVYSNA